MLSELNIYYSNRFQIFKIVRPIIKYCRIVIIFLLVFFIFMNCLNFSNKFNITVIQTITLLFDVILICTHWKVNRYPKLKTENTNDSINCKWVLFKINYYKLNYLNFWNFINLILFIVFKVYYCLVNLLMV